MASVQDDLLLGHVVLELCTHTSRCSGRKTCELSQGPCCVLWARSKDVWDDGISLKATCVQVGCADPRSSDDLHATFRVCGAEAGAVLQGLDEKKGAVLHALSGTRKALKRALPWWLLLLALSSLRLVTTQYILVAPVNERR